MRILMVTAEANPFVKTGGLADVVYALSKEEVIFGHEVAIVLPLYGLMRNQQTHPMRQVLQLDIALGWRHQTANIYQTFVEGITYYFIDNEYYFAREGIYGYPDDIERFAFFTLAVVAMLKALAKPFDLIHLHDWQPGMLPVVIRENERHEPLFKNVRFVLTIHNPAFQGMFAPSSLPDYFGLSEELYTNGAVRFQGQASSLKAAIIYCDKITTVSPTHAQELLTKEGAKGLDSVITFRQADFSGILNGIDYDEFNPRTDLYIAANYTGRWLERNKLLCKNDLIARFNLQNPDHQPVFGLVSRLTWQKGLELYLPAMRKVLERGGLVVALGSGEYLYEQALEKLRAEFPTKVGIYIGYNNKLAHQIYAGSDFFVMPSLFEPCGSGQMIAQRYGTLPIVRFTGGLKDSVIGFNGENLTTANGYGFNDFDPYWMNLTVMYAYDQYFNPGVHLRLMRNALAVNNTWKQSAQAYLKLYRSIGGK